MPAGRIHPTAVVDPGAQLDDDVEIGPYAVIGPKVAVRSGASIGAHAIVEYADIGPDCRIFPHAFVGTAPQDTSYQGEDSRASVGAGTVIRECATVHRSKHEGGVTKIGERCMLMAYSHVAHDCRLGQGVMMANYTGLAGHVEVGDFAFLSALIGVHQHVRIGTLVMISAGSMVGQDIPPLCIAQGNRASLFGLNVIGMRRAGFDSKTISLLKWAYKTLFSSGFDLKEALEKISAHSDPHVQQMAEFIKGSKRGLCRPVSSNHTP